MATKKTTSPSGKAKSGSAKPRVEAAKSKPVILDPPAKRPAPAKKSATVIDAKAKDVSDGLTGAKKPETRKAAPKPQAATGTRAFAGFLAGGAVAALIGYFAAGYINPAPITPDNSAQFAALTADYTNKIAALEAQITTIQMAPPAPNPDLDALQSALNKQAADIAKALSEIAALREQQIQGLAASGGDATALIMKYDDEIGALIASNAALSARLDEVSAIASQKLAEAQAKVEEITNNVVNSAKSVDLTLATERLRIAIESGKAYGALLSQIAAENSAEIPTALRDAAATGVQTLEQLRKDFPAAARRALKVSIQSEAGSGLTDKLGAYLKSQIGARSLEERTGDDPDAILSRIEGALSRGELAQAVEQAAQLPASGLAELSDWLSAAQTRLKVEAALDALSATLEGE